MRTSDRVWAVISVAAMTFGVGAFLFGYYPLGLPCFVIGYMLWWTTTRNMKGRD